MYKHAARESGLILCAAVLLGFTYTFFSGKGFFARSRPIDSTESSTVGPAPTPINLPDAKALFDTDAAVFVDARHYFDFRRGHIKSALNIPLSEFDSRQTSIDSLPRNKTIIVYCDGSECNSSIELAAKLYEIGFGGIRIFFGGWEDWIANKFPTESGP